MNCGHVWFVCNYVGFAESQFMRGKNHFKRNFVQGIILNLTNKWLKLLVNASCTRSSLEFSSFNENALTFTASERSQTKGFLKAEGLKLGILHAQGFRCVHSFANSIQHGRGVTACYICTKEEMSKYVPEGFSFVQVSYCLSSHLTSWKSEASSTLWYLLSWWSQLCDRKFYVYI